MMSRLLPLQGVIVKQLPQILFQILFISAGLMFVAPAVDASTPPVQIVLCHEDEDSYPWVLKDRPGLDYILLEKVGKKLNIKFQIKPLLWLRCLSELKKIKWMVLLS